MCIWQLKTIAWDNEVPDILTPATILTHKTDINIQSSVSDQLDVQDFYRHLVEMCQAFSRLVLVEMAQGVFANITMAL